MCHLRDIAMRDYQESVTTRQTHRQTDVGQSDPYVPLCFAGDTKTQQLQINNLLHIELHTSSRTTLAKTVDLERVRPKKIICVFTVTC